MTKKYVIELTEEERGVLKAAHFHIDAYGMPSWTNKVYEDMLVAVLAKIVATEPTI